MAKDPPDYEVGYGKPPKEHQFKKGRSGNPSGRPKGVKNKDRTLEDAFNPFNDVFGQALAKPFTVQTTDGRRHQKPGIQCVMEALVARAAKGNIACLKLVVPFARDWGGNIQQEKSEKIALKERYIERWAPTFEAAKRHGAPEPSQLPHPAHFHSSHETFDVYLFGPVNAYEKMDWDQLKGELRELDDALEQARRQLGPPEATPALFEKISKLTEMMELTEARVPQGWDWRECVTDYDRDYYEQRARAADGKPDRKRT